MPQVEVPSLRGEGNHERVEQLIQALDLQRHPEGGWYREVFRSRDKVLPSDGRDSRSALTSIYFLLEPRSSSRWHKVTSDEVWVHLEGAPLMLWTVLMEPGAAPAHVQLGPIDREGTQPMHVVVGGSWQAAEPMEVDGGPDHVLVACMVGPGFDFADFSLMVEDGSEATYLRQHCPELARFI